MQLLAGKENINLLDYYFLADHLPIMNIRHFHIDYNAPCLSFEPRPNSRALDTVSLVMTIGLSMKGCLHTKKPG